MTFWDSICVGEAESICGKDCPDVCGDGFCSPSEKCESCALDCCFDDGGDSDGGP
jgi:hypothetical protein